MVGKDLYNLMIIIVDIFTKLSRVAGLNYLFIYYYNYFLLL